MKQLLEVKDLSLGFSTRKLKNRVLDRVSFSLCAGEIVGIVGESGSGKSVTALSILGLLEKTARLYEGSIVFENRELTACTEKELRSIRGNEISMVFQDPMTSLNPVQRIGQQLEEVLKLHENLTKEERKKRILTMLLDVGLNQGEKLLFQYPHELSGGMRQRVMIAMAMLLKPKLLIADEPTTALDAAIQSKILSLLRKMNQQYNTSILLISHNLQVIKKICDRGIVMKSGRIVEEGTIEQLLLTPQNPYTRQLITDEISSSRQQRNIKQGNKNLVTVKQLKVAFQQRSSRLYGKAKSQEVIHNVSFSIQEGEILGVVGESGSGKSTIAKVIVGLNQNYRGEINLEVKQPRMVFQDPYSSLNPAKTVGWHLEEALYLQEKLSKSARKERVRQMLFEVGLDDGYLMRYPRELSGGQRQRVAIAAAIITRPKLLVLDEPVSSLDITVQTQTLKLLLSLQQKYQLSYLFISHDIRVVQQICDRVLVLYNGEVAEFGNTQEVFKAPKHLYTKELLNAVL